MEKEAQRYLAAGVGFALTAVAVTAGVTSALECVVAGLVFYGAASSVQRASISRPLRGSRRGSRAVSSNGERRRAQTRRTRPTRLEPTADTPQLFGVTTRGEAPAAEGGYGW